MRIASSPLVLALLAAAPAGAADVDAAQAAAMAPLAWMAGEWRGTATMMRREGEARMTSRETVISAAGGTALLVRGVHHLTQPDGSAGPVVHDAAGMITFDPASGTYRFVAHLSNGRSGTYTGTMEGGRFRWSMPVPDGATVRYDIWRNERGQWQEEGEYCAAAAPCRSIFRMLLDRQ